MKKTTKPNNRRSSPPHSPPSPNQVADLTQVKHLVFKAMGKSRTPDGHWSKVQFNPLMVTCCQQKVEPYEAVQRIIHKSQASKLPERATTGPHQRRLDANQRVRCTPRADTDEAVMSAVLPVPCARAKALEPELRRDLERLVIRHSHSYAK